MDKELPLPMNIVNTDIKKAIDNLYDLVTMVEQFKV